MGIRFVADSGSDIPQDVKGVKVVPLQIAFGADTYEDGVTLSHEKFYEMLASSDKLPITSQATPYQFGKAFRQIIEEGDEVIAVTISSKLSGTYQSAVLAAQDFPGKVHVVDSLNVSVGQRALVDFGMQLAEQGKSAEEIVDILNREKHRVKLLAVLDTLEYLKKGGRISATAAIAGGLLSIKPVLCLKEGEVAVLGKARGSKQGNNYLMKETRASGGIDYNRPLYLGYTGSGRELLEQYILDSRELWEGKIEELQIMTVGGAIGTHIGPGTIAVAYFAGSENDPS